MQDFVSRLHAIQHRDSDFFPEWKFLCGASSLLASLPVWLLLAAHRRRLLLTVLRSMGEWHAFDVLPFGYGRARPVNFESPFFYFQQGSLEEIKKYCAMLPQETLQRVLKKAPLLFQPASKGQIHAANADVGP
jgi:hypothetical protein